MTKDRPQLIALYSPVMESGKSQIANVLQLSHGFRLVKFADPFKAFIKELLMQGGAPEPIAQRAVEGDLKQEPIPGLGGRTVREMLQTMGSDWGRDMISPNLWSSIAMRKVDANLAAGISVVIDDLRFPNELEDVISRGGDLVRVIRSGAKPYRGHASEGLLDGYPMNIFHNNSTLEQLRVDAERLPGLLRNR